MIVIFQADPSNEDIRLHITRFGQKKDGSKFVLEDLPREAQRELNENDDQGYLFDAATLASEGGQIISSYHLLAENKRVILYQSHPETNKSEVILGEKMELTGLSLIAGERRRP